MYRILMLESIKSLEEAISNLGWEVPEDIRIEEPPNSEFRRCCKFSFISTCQKT